MGNEYAWRTADGSGNNVVNPDLGKAGTPYARSVAQAHPLPRHQLPDPGLVFDTLLRREKVRILSRIRFLQITLTPNCHRNSVHSSPCRSFVPDVLIRRAGHSFVRHNCFPPGHRAKLTSPLTPRFVSSVFRTSHEHVNINETSSYVDLAPLYGVNQAKQNEVRVRDGRGLLLPDVFSEDRLLLLPPAVSVLLVLFNRNHNVRVPYLPLPPFPSDSLFIPCLVYCPEALGDQ